MREPRVEQWWPHATSVLALFAMRPVGSPPQPPAIAPPPPATIVVPQVIAIRVPAPIIAPVIITQVVAPKDELACPTPPRADDEAIGVPGEPGTVTHDDAPHATIAASAAAPVIAIVRGAAYGARASTDDGRTFTTIFAGRAISSIAVDDRGRIYAIADGRLGVRDRRGRERWIDAASTCADEVCPERVIAAGDAVAWVRSGSLRTSADGGRTWRVLDDEPGDEVAGAANAGYWNGTLYGISHVSDMCGWDADDIATFDLRTRRYAFESFDNEAGSAKLDVVDDHGGSWTYRGRGVAGEKARDLRLARIGPAFGPRLLWADEGQLYELCGDRGRIVAHRFGASRVDAVDAAGRPLVADADRVFRWSARFGWRELDPQPPAEGSD